MQTITINEGDPPQALEDLTGTLRLVAENNETERPPVWAVLDALADALLDDRSEAFAHAALTAAASSHGYNEAARTWKDKPIVA